LLVSICFYTFCGSISLREEQRTFRARKGA
jgi:hypothetical protein